jgi:cellulose biosynthesis protein BcsQ
MVSSSIKRKITTASWITLFNHKGGVGKTTLAMHLAGALSEQNFRVLLVDADPQCNLSAYLIESSVLDRLLESSDTPKGRTIWTALSPLVEGAGDIRQVVPHETSIPGVDLIVGDIRLSEFEQLLNGFWLDAQALRPRGYRGISGLAQVVRSAESTGRYDFIICDTGPSISDLNHSILMATEYFIVPVFPDLFSIRALKTLGVTIARWIRDWPRIADMAPAGMNLLMEGSPRFLGYVLQRISTDSEAERHESSLAAQLERRVYEDIVEILGAQKGAGKLRRDFHLGTVPDLKQAALKSQLRGMPVWRLPAKEVQAELSRSAKEAYFAIANEILGVI